MQLIVISAKQPLPDDLFFPHSKYIYLILDFEANSTFYLLSESYIYFLL